MLKTILKINNFLFDLIIGDSRGLLFILVFFTYLINPNVTVSSDTAPTQLAAVSLLKEGNFDLNEYQNNYFVVPLNAVNTVNISGRIMSLHPVFTAVMAAPVYMLYELSGNTLESESDIAVPARVYSIIVSTLSVIFLYRAIKEITNEKTAFYSSLIYAFATCTWSTSSQEIWQHGTSQMFLAITLWLILKGRNEEKFIYYSGFTLACAVATRPTNMVIAIILPAYILIEHKKSFTKFILYATPPAIFLLAYSQIALGSIWMLGRGHAPFEEWSSPMLYGLAGLLISPSKGLLIYSPFFIYSFIGMYQTWNNKNYKILRYLTIATLATITMFSKWYAWHGGMGYSYRMLLDTTPVLMIFLAITIQKYEGKKTFNLVLAILVTYSVIFQAVGVFYMDGSWEKETGCKYFTKSMNPCLWNIENSQPMYYAKKAVNSISRVIS